MHLCMPRRGVCSANHVNPGAWMQAHDFTHGVEEEELQDCCLDLTNRLEAAEKREAELASELAVCQQNAERLEADLELQTATFSRIKSCAAAEIAQLTERIASLTQPTADAAKKGEKWQRLSHP